MVPDSYWNPTYQLVPMICFIDQRVSINARRYAFMQAVGMVNDHVVSCLRREECKGP